MVAAIRCWPPTRPPTLAAVGVATGLWLSQISPQTARSPHLRVEPPSTVSSDARPKVEHMFAQEPSDAAQAREFALSLVGSRWHVAS